MSRTRIGGVTKDLRVVIELVSLYSISDATSYLDLILYRQNFPAHLVKVLAW